MAEYRYIEIIKILLLVLVMKLAELSSKTAALISERKVLQIALEMMDDQDAKIEGLEKEVSLLKKLLFRVEKKAVKKTSRNSNLPTSKEIVSPKRNRKNNRVKSGKQVGGQPGHKGYTLELFDNPNMVIPMIPKACPNCGVSLNGAEKVLLDSKQVVDLPPGSPDVAQYDRYEIDCPNCGYTCRGEYPKEIKAKSQYGSNLRASINYMLVYQYMPFQRLQYFYETFFNLHLSTATLCNTIKRSAKNFEKAYYSIRDFLEKSNWVGGDETGIKVDGNKSYFWVWQNKSATFIVNEATRGKEVIYKYFPNGFPDAVLVSDRYPAHLSTPSKEHQICWAHLLRLLNYLEEAEHKEWAENLKSLFYRALDFKEKKPAWDRENQQVKQLENDLNIFLYQELDDDLFPETNKLRKQLIDKRHFIFTFLYYEGVPFHNNDAELAIRNAKIKMKISGQFKSEAGAKHYAIMRSIIDTLLKNGKPIFESLCKLEKGEVVDFGF